MDTTLIRVRQKILIAVMALAVLLAFCGCEIHHRSPDTYTPSKWVCMDPDIMFEVDEDDQIYFEIQGVRLTDRYEPVFMNTRLFIHDEKSGEVVFSGEPQYSSQTMRVHVTQDDYFSGAYTGKTIVFERVDHRKRITGEDIFIISIGVIAVIATYVALRKRSCH